MANANREATQLADELPSAMKDSFLDEEEFDTRAYMGARIRNYTDALQRATKALGRQGFEIAGDAIDAKERERTKGLVRFVTGFVDKDILGPAAETMEKLRNTGSPNSGTYSRLLGEIGDIRTLMASEEFSRILDHDPRNILVLAASKRAPQCLDGFPFTTEKKRLEKYQKLCCSILKVIHTYRLLTENPVTRSFIKFGAYLASHDIGLINIHRTLGTVPIPSNEDYETKLAFIQVRGFFENLLGKVVRGYPDDMHVLTARGRKIRINNLESRLKSPSSMTLKLGKKRQETVETVINDLLGVSFELEDEKDTLPFLRILQDNGIGTQERTPTDTIHQTIYTTKKDLAAVINHHAPRASEADRQRLAKQMEARHSLERKPHSRESGRYRTYQFKTSLPIATRISPDGRIIIPRWNDLHDAEYPDGEYQGHPTNLTVEFQISDVANRKTYKEGGRVSHPAYKFKGALGFMAREFKGLVGDPFDSTGKGGTDTKYEQLEKDLDQVFASGSGTKSVIM